MNDLIQEQLTLTKKLDYAIKQHKERGIKYATCERDYKIALAKFITTKRFQGEPVTILNDLAKGEPEIAELRKDRDIAKSLYDTCREAINSYKLQIRIVNEQINRDWNSGGR